MVGAGAPSSRPSSSTSIASPARKRPRAEEEAPGAGKVQVMAGLTRNVLNIPRFAAMYVSYHIYGYGSIPINTIFSGMNIHLPAILMFTSYSDCPWLVVSNIFYFP